MRDAVYRIIRESRQHAHRARTGFLPSLASWGRGGRVDGVILDVTAAYSLVEIFVAEKLPVVI